MRRSLTDRVRPSGRLARLGGALGLFAAASLALAPSAFASYGRGLLSVGDKTIVTFGFCLIAFFVVLVATLSAVQWTLDKRKHERKAAEKAMVGNGYWRGGW